jgi:hypothetical protein
VYKVFRHFSICLFRFHCETSRETALYTNSNHNPLWSDVDSLGFLAIFLNATDDRQKAMYTKQVKHWRKSRWLNTFTLCTKRRCLVYKTGWKVVYVTER